MSHSIFAAQPRHLVRAFHVTAKPVGSRCNLDCTYCYYLHKSRLLPETATEHISDDLLEEFIQQYIIGQDAETISFSWHGGEPTLLGLEFFHKVIDLQRKYAGAKRITNDLQTNGSLLDDAWCEFFKEHGFLVGLSIDGPKHLHDCFRASKSGESSFDLACRAARLLQKHNVLFNTLTVVNSVTARHPAEVYRFLTEELGSRRLQWLPCVEPKDFCTTAPGRWDPAQMPIQGTMAAKPGNPDSVVTDWSVDPGAWGEFLCQTFDLWLKNGIGTVVVNWFESLVGQWMRQPPQICTLAEVCGRALAIEADGSVYSCDHYVYPEYRLGNLFDGNRQLTDMVYSPEQRKFGCNKRDTLPDYCKKCAYCFACNGECPKNRFIKTPDGQPGLNYLCSGIKRFLTYADPHLRQIVAELHRPRNTADP
jgi:uncharacterized protein